ncbi:hypothetical protein A6A04_18720 [Paramagnetospirillum marisnigri]|uniref:Uncharacterized protein n=2 Tax=Paramagnetospirillum marisnigri TaxID=1285242 RepID=A0A178MMI3_9PROT|nr:hypothetical protein A6A04_18720 [Paramagnetospirillum marisnigri]
MADDGFGERSMKRAIVIAAMSILAGCSQGTYEPVVDLKASKNPAEMQMDWMGCEFLIKKYGLEDAATTKCLEGRGHNVIGVVYR